MQTIKKQDLDWCFWTVVLEKTLESPLGSKEIKPVNPKENQPWLFIGKTDAKAEAPILWPPDSKSPLTGKDPDAGKDWGQEKKGVTEDEMAGGIIDSMDMSLTKLQEVVKVREAWHAADQGVEKSQTWLSNWATTRAKNWVSAAKSGYCDAPCMHHQQRGGKTT